MNRIPVPRIDQNPKIVESIAFELKIANELEEAEAEKRRVDALQTTSDDLKHRAAMRADGKTPPPSMSLAEMRAAVSERVLETRMAKEIAHSRYEQLMKDEGLKLRQSLKPAHDKVVNDVLVPALLQVHSALCTIERLKHDLGAQGLGWYSIPCCIDSEHLYEAATATLRELVQLGYAKKMPVLR
jgi:hypothetical protein